MPEAVEVAARAAVPSMAEALARDAGLADDVAPAPGNARETPADVLLTGATGFLGGEVALALLRATPARLHLVVRGKNERTARERWEALCRQLDTDPARVELVEGDLEARISAEPDLARRIDTVVHCAAVVNLFAPYAALRTPNVLGARAMLEFAARGRPKAVHFVSTTGVFLSARYRSATVLESEPVEGHEGLRNGYAQSKWVADTMMARARQRGFDVTVVRPAFVGWHSRTGQAGEHDLIALLLRSSVAAECAPELDLQINSSPVDHVAATLARLVASASTRGATYHLANARAVPFVDLAAMAGLRVVEVARWRKAVAARVPELAKFAAMVDASRSDESSGVVELYREHDRRYDDAYLRQALGADYRNAPPVDREYLGRLLSAKR